MQWRGRRTSSNIEDRRGAAAAPAAGGDRHRSRDRPAGRPVLRGRHHAAPRQGGGAASRPSGAGRAELHRRRGRGVRRRRARRHRGGLGRDLRRSASTTASRRARALRRRHGLGLRRGRCGDGAVLLPQRPADLPRHRLLPGDRPSSSARAASSRAPTSSPTRSPPRPARARPARPGPGAAGAGGAAESNALSVRVELAGRLLLRPLGARRPSVSASSEGDIEDALERRGAHRRRRAAAGEPGRRRARQLHPRLERAAPALVLRRLPQRPDPNTCDTFAAVKRSARSTRSQPRSTPPAIRRPGSLRRCGSTCSPGIASVPGRPSQEATGQRHSPPRR
jgi:hypothetical protein